jgi:hypothetical protein
VSLYAPLDEADVSAPKSRRLIRRAAVAVALAVLLGLVVRLTTRDRAAAGQANGSPAPAASGMEQAAPVSPANGAVHQAGEVPASAGSKAKAEERSEPNTPEERYVRNYILDRVNDPSSVKFLGWGPHRGDAGNLQIRVRYRAKDRRGIMESVEQDFAFENGAFVAASPARKS